MLPDFAAVSHLGRQVSQQVTSTGAAYRRDVAAMWPGWYNAQLQATDDEVCGLLEQARREHAVATRLSGHTEENDSL